MSDDSEGGGPTGAGDAPSEHARPDLDTARPAIAARLAAARAMAGLSQGQAAKLLGLHRPTVSEIEAARRRVAAEELAAFAHLYGVSVAWLVGDTAPSIEAGDVEVELAARELAKLKPEDRQRVLEMVSALRNRGDVNRGDTSPGGKR